MAASYFWRHERPVSIPREAVCRQRLSGPIFANGLAKILPRLETEIVKRSAHAKGFVQLPKRWIVERTIAWLNRCRRLAKDWENLNRNALGFLKLASIRLMLRKLCNP
jgi:putative transposase